MKDNQPEIIFWQRDKVAFKPPQKNWMQQPAIQKIVQQARQVIVNEKLLSAELLDKPVDAKQAYDGNNIDWSY